MKKLFAIRSLLWFLPVVLMSLGSCRTLAPNIMLQAGKDYKYDTLRLDSTTMASEYRLAPDDIIEFRLFANDGFKMVDLIQNANNVQNNFAVRQGFEYTLDNKGFVKLPILGMVSLDSMTIREAEAHLEERYSVYYIKPFVIIKVANRRVTVFPGEAGAAKVIGLANANTTVFEAIAQAGGISANGKAHKITLIRPTENPRDPLVYRLDLSKIENIEQGNIVVQSGDIIYIEPRKRLASRTLQEVTPIMGLISTAFTLYILITRL